MCTYVYIHTYTFRRETVNLKSIYLYQFKVHMLNNSWKVFICFIAFEKLIKEKGTTEGSELFKTLLCSNLL